MTDYAILNEAGNAIQQIGNLSVLFPGVKFPANGPDSQWLTEARAYLVKRTLPHDAAAERLVAVEPFIAAPGDVRAVAIEPFTLAELKANKRTDLRRRFQQERDKGVTVNGDLIATTHAARQELAALSETIGGGSQKAVTRAGERVVLNKAAVDALLAAVDAHHAACNAREYDLDAAIESAADKAALDAVDITSEWPE